MYTKFPVINFLINIQYGNCFQGFRCVQAEECWHKSLTPLMEEVRQMMGDKPVYISFDIDGLDPCYAPGTGENIIFFRCTTTKHGYQSKRTYGKVVRKQKMDSYIVG
jgi:hypothetical protein